MYVYRIVTVSTLLKLAKRMEVTKDVNYASEKSVKIIKTFFCCFKVNLCFFPGPLTSFTSDFADRI